MLLCVYQTLDLIVNIHYNEYKYGDFRSVISIDQSGDHGYRGKFI